MYSSPSASDRDASVGILGMATTLGSESFFYTTTYRPVGQLQCTSCAQVRLPVTGEAEVLSREEVEQRART